MDYNGRSVCYTTDNEMFHEDSEFYLLHYDNKLQEFCKNAAALIINFTYTDAEHTTKVGWGYSWISKVVNLADNANVKILYLFHHDPDQTDSDIDAKLETTVSLLSKRNSHSEVFMPSKGQCVTI